MARTFSAKSVAFQALRRAFSRTKLANDARAKALSPKKGVRGGRRYVCAHCGGDFGIKEINIDHIDPAVPVMLSTETLSMRMLFERIFCDPKNLEAICVGCHSIKTKSETAERAAWRKKKKYLVVRIVEGSLIKVISIIDLKNFPVDLYEILSVWCTRQDADTDHKRRKKLKG